MQNIPFTYARKNFKETIDKICDNHTPVLITRGKKDPVVMMSLEDYNSYEETARIMSDPVYYNEILESIKELEEGKGIEMDIIEK